MLLQLNKDEKSVGDDISILDDRKDQVPLQLILLSILNYVNV